MCEQSIFEFRDTPTYLQAKVRLMTARKTRSRRYALRLARRMEKEDPDNIALCLACMDFRDGVWYG